MTTNAKPYAIEGLDPDDPAVITAIDLVRWDLSLAAVTVRRVRSRSPEWSSTVALGACVLIASMPFSALAFDSYPWLAAMISPFGAFRWNRNLPGRAPLDPRVPLASVTS
jgi:hypothetical protein